MLTETEAETPTVDDALASDQQSRAGIYAQYLAAPVTLDQIHVFIAIMDEGSFGRAATRLGKAPSAISYAVGVIERALGVQLFDRSGPKAVPTLVARSMFQTALELVTCENRLRKLARSARVEPEPVIETAVDPLFSPLAGAQAVAALRRRFPDVVVRWTTHSPEALTELVCAGTAHVGIVGTTPRCRGLECTRLSAQRLIPVASQHHPLAGSTTPLSVDQLRRYDEIVVSSRSSAESARLCASSLEAVKALVAAGLGWAYLPAESLPASVDGDSGLKIISAPSLLVPFSVIHARAFPPGPAASLLIQLLADSASESSQSESRESFERILELDCAAGCEAGVRIVTTRPDQDRER